VPLSVDCFELGFRALIGCLTMLFALYLGFGLLSGAPPPPVLIALYSGFGPLSGAPISCLTRGSFLLGVEQKELLLPAHNIRTRLRRPTRVF